MFRIALALILPAMFLAGQSDPPAASGRWPKTALQREEFVAHLHRVRMERLQQSLGITEEKARGIADRWASFDVDNRDHRQRMKQLHQQVNSLLLGPLSEEEKNLKIRPLVEQFSALRLRQEELRRKFEEDIRGMLTPAQQGRFILVVEDIQRALLEAMREQRKQSGQ